MKIPFELRMPKRVVAKMPKRGSVTARVCLSVALLAATAAIMGVGAFATFTDTEAVSQTTSSGTVDLDPVSGNAVNNRLSVGASNIAAGDTIQRTVLVRNGGTVALATTNGVVLATSATTSSVLDTPASADTLKMTIDICSVAWTETGGPPYTYTCSGSQASVISSQNVVGSYDLSSSLNLAGGANNYLRVTLTLPSSAPNSFQGKTSTINYSFTATQRTGQAQ